MDSKALFKRVKDAQSGDSAAFGEIYGSVQNEAWRFALSYLRHKEDAEDAVQNTALIAFRSIKNLKKAESFRSWFFKIEYNECMKILQQRKNTPLALDDVPETADDSYEKLYLETGLKTLMDELDETDRRIIELSVFAGLKSHEIAEVTGLRPGSVRSRLSRALHSMKERLIKDGVINE